MLINILDACTDASFAQTMLFIKKLIDIICIVTPILLILLLTIEFVKAVISGEEDEIKKVQRRSIKRITFAVVLFFVPLIIETSFGLLDSEGKTFMGCYNKADDKYVENLVKEANRDQKDKQKQEKKDIKDRKEKASKEAEKREKLAKDAVEKIAKLAQDVTNAITYTGNYIPSNGKVMEAGHAGIRETTFAEKVKSWKWEYVMRFKDPAKALKAVECMEKAVANNKNIKYCGAGGSWGQLYDRTKDYGFDPSVINSRTCTTCSPLVSVCINYAGISMNRGLNAGNQDQFLPPFKNRSQHFQIIHDSKIAQDYTKLYRGDILFVEGHTLIAT